MTVDKLDKLRALIRLHPKVSLFKEISGWGLDIRSPTFLDSVPDSLKGEINHIRYVSNVGEIEIVNYPNLKKVDIWMSRQVLRISNCPSLTLLYMHQQMKELNTDNSFRLEELKTSLNNFKDLNLKNLEDIKSIEITEGNLKELDLRKLGKVTTLVIKGVDRLDRLWTPKSLENLQILESSLRTLDLSGCDQLIMIICTNLRLLRNLKIPEKIELLYIINSGLDQLDLSKLSNLKFLSIKHCAFKYLDLRGLEKELEFELSTSGTLDFIDQFGKEHHLKEEYLKYEGRKYN